MAMESYKVEVLTIEQQAETWWFVRECSEFGEAMRTAREINNSNARVRVTGFKHRPDFSGYPVELFSAEALQKHYSKIDAAHTEL